MTDQQTWEQACERVGVWDGLEQCRRWDEARNPLEPCPHGYYRDHNRTCPPIGDPAATLAMIKFYLGNHWGDITIGSHPTAEPYFYVVGCPQGAETLELALAAAVCALKEKL